VEKGPELGLEQWRWKWRERSGDSFSTHFGGRDKRIDLGLEVKKEMI
jgi:hypothetical protein